MQKLIKKYAKICHYIDFNIANMQIICKKICKKICSISLNMQQKYAINMQLICRICISLCFCIFCLYMHSPVCCCHRLLAPGRADQASPIHWSIESGWSSSLSLPIDMSRIKIVMIIDSRVPSDLPRTAGPEKGRDVPKNLSRRTMIEQGLVLYK